VISRLKGQFVAVVQRNIKGYILLSAIFVCGTVLAIVCNTKAVQEEEIRIFFADYISGITNSGMDATKTFYFAMINYVQFAVCAFFCAITIIGAPLFLLYTFVKGFSFGTVLCCIFKAFGPGAFLIFFCVIFPHALIEGPCCLAYGLRCTRDAYGLVTGNIHFKKNLFTPLGFGILFLCIASVAALMQSYLEPLLIKMISSYLIN